MPAIRRISSVLSSPVRSMYYRTITTATVILLPPSPRAPCSGRLLSVPGFLIFLWISWLRVSPYPDPQSLGDRGTKQHVSEPENQIYLPQNHQRKTNCVPDRSGKNERFQRFHHLLQPSRTGGLSGSRKKRHVRGTRQAYKAWDPADTAQSFHIIKTFRLIRIKFRYHLLQYSCRLLQF